MTIYRPVPLKEVDRPGSSVLKGGECAVSTGTLRDESDLGDSAHALSYEVDNLGSYFNLQLGEGENFLYSSEDLNEGDPLIFYSNTGIYPEALSPDEVYFVNSVSGGNFDLVNANGDQVNITDLYLGDLRAYHAFSLLFDCSDGKITVEGDVIQKRATTNLTLPSGSFTVYRLRDLDDISVTSWINWDGLDYTVFDSEKLALSINTSGNLVVDYSGAPTIESSGSLSVGWNHIGVTYLSDTNELRLYLDGSHDSLYEDITLPSITDYSVVTGNANQDLRLYDRMVYWSEVEELASARPLLSSDNTNIDLYRGAAPDNYVRVFDGATQYAYASQAFAQLFDGSTSFTFSIKYKSNTGVGSNGGVLLINKGTGTPSNIGFQIALPSNGQVFARLADGTSNIYLGDTIATDDNEWHTATLVYDKDADQATFYVDKRLVNSLSASGLGAFGPVNANVRFGIGALTYSTGSNYHYYTGRLHDLRVYDSALTQDQVEAIVDGVVLDELSPNCLLHTWLDSVHPEKDWDASGNNEPIVVVNTPSIVVDNDAQLNRRQVYGYDNERTDLRNQHDSELPTGLSMVYLGNYRWQLTGSGSGSQIARWEYLDSQLGDEVIDWIVYVESVSSGTVNAISFENQQKANAVPAGDYATGTNMYRVGGWQPTSNSFFVQLDTDSSQVVVVRFDKLEKHHAYAPKDQSVTSGYPQSIIGNTLTELGSKDWKYNDLDSGALKLTATERIVLPTSFWNTDGSEEIDIEFWAKFTSTGSIQYIAYNYDNGTGWQLYLQTNNKLRFFVRDGVGSDASDSERVIYDEWTHYRLHYTGGNNVNNANWYINGIQSPISVTGGPFGSMDIPTGITTLGSAGASGSSRFASEIADFKVKINGQLLSYFPFDERSGSTVYDVAENASYTIENYSSDSNNRTTQTNVYYTDVYGYNGSTIRIPASYSMNKNDVLGNPIQNKPAIYPSAGLLLHRYDKNYSFTKTNRSGISIDSVNDNVEYGISNFTGDLDVYIENCEGVTE